MPAKKFNPTEWLPQPETIIVETPAPQPAVTTQPVSNPAKQEEVEALIAAIESKGVDITGNYENWLNLGFALADGFGESGRDYYHRLSRFHSDYSLQDCNTQFTNCLKSQKQGITLKTFFHYAKAAGFTLPRKEPETMAATDRTPTFPAAIYWELPLLLKQVVEVATTNEERDLLLLGSLTSLSACFPKVSGLYDGKVVYPYLFLFITAQASAGKGRLVHCRQLAAPIHKHMREQSKILRQQYEIALSEYNASKGTDVNAEKPSKPPEKMLFIPANNSASGVFQLLSDNEGRGLIFETEGDTLAQAFKTDYGNYSDGFRKAFHHETISYYRRTDREYVDIEAPCLAAVLSGTPKQVSALIPNAENGLFSRFMFYSMNVTHDWKDVFAIRTDNGLDDYFDSLGTQVYSLYQSINSSSGIRFGFTPAQEQDFNALFKKVQNKYLTLCGSDYLASIRRLGLVTFRIAMLLSTLRLLETAEMPEVMVCDDQDYKTAKAITEVLVQHAARVFSELPADVKPVRRNNQKERFLHALPATFSRQQFIAIATAEKINEKTAERYITQFVAAGLIHRDVKDHYINPAVADTAESEGTADT